MDSVILTALITAFLSSLFITWLDVSDDLKGDRGEHINAIVVLLFSALGLCAYIGIKLAEWVYHAL